MRENPYGLSPSEADRFLKRFQRRLAEAAWAWCKSEEVKRVDPKGQWSALERIAMQSSCGCHSTVPDSTFVHVLLAAMLQDGVGQAGQGRLAGRRHRRRWRFPPWRGRRARAP